MDNLIKKEMVELKQYMLYTAEHRNIPVRVFTQTGTGAGAVKRAGFIKDNGGYWVFTEFCGKFHPIHLNEVLNVTLSSQHIDITLKSAIHQVRG